MSHAYRTHTPSRSSDPQVTDREDLYREHLAELSIGQLAEKYHDRLSLKFRESYREQLTSDIVEQWEENGRED